MKLDLGFERISHWLILDNNQNGIIFNVIIVDNQNYIDLISNIPIFNMCFEVDRRILFKRKKNYI